MPPVSLLDMVGNTPWIAYLLAARFDFDVTDPTHEPIEPLRLASGDRLEPIARDASGGTYFLCGEGGDERPVLYTDSEGGAALLATSLAAALTTLIELPYWPDCLTRSDGGDLDTARAALPELEEEYLEDEPDLPAERRRLLDALGLVAPEDSLSELLTTARESGPGFVVLTEDGRPYLSLL